MTKHLHLLIVFGAAASGCATAPPTPAAQAATPAPATEVPAPSAPAAAPAAPAAQQQPPAPDANSFAQGQKQIVVRAAEANYGPCPPTIPFECEMAVLEGSRQKAGLFTIRFRSDKRG